MPSRVTLLLAAALLLLAAAAARPPAALAAKNAEVSIMDDQLLLGAPAAKVNQEMGRFAALGVDRLRVSAFWAHHAPGAQSTTKPAGFDASNHLDPGYNWRDLDPVAAAARAYGIDLMISVTTPAPYWATSDPGKENDLLRPDPAEFARFARAVATRYGSVTDQYGVSNEPNQGGWLQPQSDGGGLASPHHYRKLVLAAYPALKSADPKSTVLLGELSSSGFDDRGPAKTIRPLSFLRAMACLNSRYKPVKSGRCADFEPIPTDEFGHHPYNLFRAPTKRSAKRDDAAIGDTRRLLSFLDRLTKRKRILPSGGGKLDVYFTEFGYQTDPPDPFAGISLGRQDRYLQDAAFLAWRTPRVRAINQFRLVDGAIDSSKGIAGFHEFQSGLLFRDRSPKPSYRSFSRPFAVSTTRPRKGTRVLFWGQVRPGSEHTVSLQYRKGSSGPFKKLTSVETDGRGYFARRLKARTGTFRFAYADGPSSRIALRVR